MYPIGYIYATGGMLGEAAYRPRQRARYARPGTEGSALPVLIMWRRATHTKPLLRKTPLKLGDLLSGNDVASISKSDQCNIGKWGKIPGQRFSAT